MLHSSHIAVQLWHPCTVRNLLFAYEKYTSWDSCLRQENIAGESARSTLVSHFTIETTKLQHFMQTKAKWKTVKIKDSTDLDLPIRAAKMFFGT